MKNLILALSLMTFSAFADSPSTVWVDGSLSDYTGHDGTTAALALRTIQQGVEAVAESGTVYVKPGVYAEGEILDNIENNSVSNRVWINKALTLESTDGKDVTHIVGAYSKGGNLYGDDAVRCLTISAKGVVIKGFTIRDGASRNGSNIPATHAGGVCFISTGVDSYVVDCVISNCVATRGGAMREGMAIRTLFVNNRANNSGSACRYSYVYSSIFIGNSSYGSDVNVGTVDSSERVVHCTFVGNYDSGLRPGGNKEMNAANNVSVFSKTRGLYVGDNQKTTMCSSVFDSVERTESSTCTFTDVVTDAAPYQIVSPFEGDFRVVSGSACDGNGRITSSSPSWVPTAYRGYDFYGNPFVRDEKCNIGAVAESVAMEGGFAVFACSGNVPPSVRTPVLYRNLWRSDRNNAIYLGSRTFPRQVYVVASSGSNPPIAFTRSGWNIKRPDNQSVVMADGITPWKFLDSDDGAWFVLPDSERIVTNMAIYATSVKYVSPTGNDEDHDGSSEKTPYRSFAKAVNGSADQGLVLALPGTYDEGGVEAYGMTNRLYVNKPILVRAKNGPAVTTIKGNGLNVAWKSDNVRPVAMASGINCAVQGFTLTGGMTAENKDTDAGRGGAVRGGGFRSQLLDCIVISNRAGRAGGAYAVWAQRCRIVNNTSSSISILRGGCLASSCLFYGNTASGSDIAGDSYAFGCTGYENNFAKHLNSTTCGYNSVFNGGIEDASGGDDVKYERAGCFVGASSATQPGVRVDVAPFTNPAQGDFSIRRCSTAWRSGGVTGFPNRSGYFAFFTTDDIDGRPFVLSNGTVLPGAVQQVGPSGNGLILLFR